MQVEVQVNNTHFTAPWVATANKNRSVAMTQCNLINFSRDWKACNARSQLIFKACTVCKS